MAKPIPGKRYKTVAGDTLSLIAGQAYGDINLWPRIFRANTLPSGDPDKIGVGEILIIPLLTETDDLRQRFFQSETTDGFVLKLGRRRIPVISGRVTRTMDTVADGWSALIAWEPEVDPELDKLILPESFTEASVFLDGRLLVRGLLYLTETVFTTEGRTAPLQGGSFTMDLLDSNLLPPYEDSNFTLEQHTKRILDPLGIGLEIQPELLLQGQFERVVANPTEKIADHLMKLAQQRQILTSSTPEGKLLYTQADISSRSVGTVEEKGKDVQEWKFASDGRRLFHTYRAISQGASFDQKVGIAKDENIPRSRVMTFQVNNSLKGDLNQIAAWKRNNAIAKSLKLSLPVTDWLAPNGSLWRENTIVTVRSKTFRVPDGFDFLIRKVEYKFNKEGRTAVLDIVPPSLYTSQAPNLPWRENL